MQLGEKIRFCRAVAGLKQKRVAEKVGITPETLSNYERGLTEPSALNLACIADVLGVSMDWLCDRTPKDEWEINQMMLELEMEADNEQVQGR